MHWEMPVLQGRPIYIQHLGQVNIKKIYDITTEERMLKFHVQEYERCIQYIMPACSKVAGRHIEQTFAILDVKGASAVVYADTSKALRLQQCSSSALYKLNARELLLEPSAVVNELQDIWARPV